MRTERKHYQPKFEIDSPILFSLTATSLRTTIGVILHIWVKYYTLSIYLFISEFIYLKFVSDFADYRGCFQTPASSSPNITILVTTDNLVSVNLCKQLCLGRNFNYSLTNQKSCACTNNHTSLTLVDDKKCQNPCPSQNLLLCGSQDTWALHLLGKHHSKITYIYKFFLGHPDCFNCE